MSVVPGTITDCCVNWPQRMRVEYQAVVATYHTSIRMKVLKVSTGFASLDLTLVSLSIHADDIALELLRNDVMYEIETIQCSLEAFQAM